MDRLIVLVALLGTLVLVGSALASYRLGWSKIARLVLIWLAIFGSVFLVVLAFQGVLAQ